MRKSFFSFVFFVSSICTVSANTYTTIEPSFTEAPEVNGEGFRYVMHLKEPVIRHPEKVTITVGPGVYFTGNHSWGMTYRNSSYIEISFEAPAEHFGKEIELYMIHLAALVGGVHRNSPVDITINGKMFKHRYDPLSAGWVYDKWDITNWVVEGKNTLRIQLLDGICQYWLNSLFITFKNH